MFQLTLSVDSMFDLGFELNYVLMDREFHRAELLDEIKGMKGITKFTQLYIKL